MEQENKCGYKQGALPACAPLALAYVPMQSENPPKYEASQALTRGTLFPGLDLPFMNKVNSEELDNTPLCELMALKFVIAELQLYMDTHSDDAEAFNALKSFINLYETGKAKYIKLYGPINIYDLETSKNYTWLKSPWPWEFKDNGEE